MLGPQLSVFAQMQGVSENDLRGDTSGGYADAYLERGEMWVYYQQAFGLPLHVEAGRLDFEDDRRWWWDQDLDAVRVTLAAGDLEVALAAAQELGATRSDRGVEPDEDAILRGLLEASWDWRPTHSLQAFALRHVVRSPAQGVDDIVRRAREDESDARLTWLGVRTEVSGGRGARDGQPERRCGAGEVVDHGHRHWHIGCHGRRAWHSAFGPIHTR